VVFISVVFLFQNPLSVHERSSRLPAPPVVIKNKTTEIETTEEEFSSLYFLALRELCGVYLCGFFISKSLISSREILEAASPLLVIKK
jgi:hypothetical protein